MAKPNKMIDILMDEIGKALTYVGSIAQIVTSLTSIATMILVYLIYRHFYNENK